MPFVYSTLTADTEYTDYHPSESGARDKERMIRIKGGANVAQPLNLLMDKNLTPVGNKTKVTDEELAFLRTQAVFILHEKNGFVKVVDSLKPTKVEIVARDMEEKDASAPFTEADYDINNKKARGTGNVPKTGKIV